MAKNTIRLKTAADINEEYIIAAGQTPYPGTAVELDSDGKITAQSAGDTPTRMFILEDELRGKTISDIFAAGDRAQVWTAQPGDICYGILAVSETAVIGSVLALANSGHLAVKDSTHTTVIGIALEAVTTDSSSTANIAFKVI